MAVAGAHGRRDRGVEGGVSGVLDVVRHDERGRRILRVRDGFEVHVTDPSVELGRPAEELVADAGVHGDGRRDLPVVREEHVEIVEAEPLVGHAELRVGFARKPAEQHREVLELLELGRLLFRQVRIELVAPELAAHAKRVRSAGPGQRVADRPRTLAPLVVRIVRTPEGEALHDRPRRADVVSKPLRRDRIVEERRRVGDVDARVREGVERLVERSRVAQGKDASAKLVDLVPANHPVVRRGDGRVPIGPPKRERRGERRGIRKRIEAWEVRVEQRPAQALIARDLPVELQRVLILREFRRHDVALPRQRVSADRRARHAIIANRRRALARRGNHEVAGHRISQVEERERRHPRCTPSRSRCCTAPWGSRQRSRG